MKNANGVSHTARVRAQFENDEHSVLFFTGLTLNELTDYKLDTGQRWIMRYCLAIGIWDNIAAELWQEPELLQWWNVEWRKMDHFFILPVLHRIEAKDREEVYKAMHCEVFLSEHPCFTQMECSLMQVLRRKYGKDGAREMRKEINLTRAA